MTHHEDGAREDIEVLAFWSRQIPGEPGNALSQAGRKRREERPGAIGCERSVAVYPLAAIMAAASGDPTISQNRPSACGRTKKHRVPLAARRSMFSRTHDSRWSAGSGALVGFAALQTVASKEPLFA